MRSYWLVRCNPDPSDGFDLQRFFADGNTLVDNMTDWSLRQNMRHIAYGDGIAWYVNRRGVCAFGTITREPFEDIGDMTYWGQPVDGWFVGFEVDRDCYARPATMAAMRADPIVSKSLAVRQVNGANAQRLERKEWLALQPLAG